MENKETMMQNNETPAAEQIPEAAEQRAEQPPRTYTQEEVDGFVEKRLARERARITRQYDREYGAYRELADVAMAGTGTKSVGEARDILTDFYGKKGVQMPQKAGFSDQDIKVLARADADELIGYGDEDVEDELRRLTDIGIEKLTPREKARMLLLDQHQKGAQRARKLSAIGVTEDVYSSREFQNFAGNFNPNTPIEYIHELYAKTQPRKEHRTMGSMKNAAGKEVRDFYSPEDIAKLSTDDLLDDSVWNAVRKSMTGGR